MRTLATTSRPTSYMMITMQITDQEWMRTGDGDHSCYERTPEIRHEPQPRLKFLSKELKYQGKRLKFLSKVFI